MTMLSPSRSISLMTGSRRAIRSRYDSPRGYLRARPGMHLHERLLCAATQTAHGRYSVECMNGGHVQDVQDVRVP